MTDTNSLLDALAKPPPPPSELDELISRDPLDLSAQDIDAIIQYQRSQRAKREAGGGRSRKASVEATMSSVTGADLAALVRGANATKGNMAEAASKPVVGTSVARRF
jgi:hypothetical protein